MSIRTTFILLLILAALGGYVYWTEIRGHEAREAAESKKDRVFDFKEEDVEKLEVQTAVDETTPVTIARDGADKWNVVSPLQTEADKAAADGFVSSLMYLTMQRDVEDNPKDLEKYGLKDAKGHISLWMKGKKDPITLSIGEKSRIGNSYYGMRADLKKVIILDTSYESSLRKGIFDLRDKKVFPIDEEKAKRITIKREKETVVLEKTADGRWRLKQPLDVEGSKSEVDDILRELKNLQATKFSQEEMTDPKPFGFDKPQVVATVEFEGSTVPAEVIVGAKGTHERDLFARTSLKKPVVEVNESIFKTLTKAVAEFREKHAISFDQFDVQKLSLVYPDKTITCVRSGESDWKLESPIKGEADGPEVDNILYTAEGLQAKEFDDEPDASLAKYGLDKPKVKLQLWQKGDKEPRVVLVGGETPDKTKTYVKNPRQPNLYVIETSATEGLFPRLDDLKKKPESASTAPKEEDKD